MGNDGNLRSCIAEENNGPFLQMYESDCKNQGEDGKIFATVTLKMCNRNTDPKYIFRPNEKTKFKINSVSYYDGFVDGYTLDPNDPGFKNTGEFEPIYPGECKTMIQQLEIHSCGDKKKFPMGVQMEGNMNTALGVGQSYCYAYVNRKNIIKRYPDEAITNPTLLAPSIPNNVIMRTDGQCRSMVRIENFFADFELATTIPS